MKSEQISDCFTLDSDSHFLDSGVVGMQKVERYFVVAKAIKLEKGPSISHDLSLPHLM